MFSLKKVLLLACTNGHVSTNFIEIDTSDAQVVRRPGSKAFDGNNNLLVIFLKYKWQWNQPI